MEYIGHVIEDCGTHARLGLGTGHFFKALWGQHMSGIDVVLQQIRPGYDIGMNFTISAEKGYITVPSFTMALQKWGFWAIWIRRKREEPCARFMAPMAGVKG